MLLLVQVVGTKDGRGSNLVGEGRGKRRWGWWERVRGNEEQGFIVTFGQVKSEINTVFGQADRLALV